MTSEIDICNIALSNIRGGEINSFNEASPAAKLCKLKYPILRDQILRDVPWQFAHKVAVLALLTDDLFNWAYAYQYPTDCLRINRLLINFEEIESGGSEVISKYYNAEYPVPNLNLQTKYELINVDGNMVIAANEPDLRIDYVARVTDPKKFDSQFVMALSYLMASELAIPMVGPEKGRPLRAESLRLYTSYIDEATASNLNEQYRPIADSEFVTIRS